MLGAFGTTANSTVLHTDVSLLPRRPSSRASWNYRVADAAAASPRPTVTYYLNKLQARRARALLRHAEPRRRDRPGDASSAAFEYAHPLYTFESLAAQERLPRIDGRRRTFFCGAYHGFGFHEDGLASGLRAAAALGVPA